MKEEQKQRKHMVGLDNPAYLALRIRAAKSMDTITDTVTLLVKQGCPDEYKEAEKILKVKSKDEEP